MARSTSLTVENRHEILLKMLTTRRPAGSAAERAFIRAYIRPLGATPDAAGNYSLRIGNAPVLWSCHTDTVHSKGGTQAIQKVGRYIHLAANSKSDCLGADDTAGVWLMREMIRSNVPGLYIFHRAEEKGCIGSRWIAKHRKKSLEGIKYAIALDRKGKQDVITHQLSRSCSDAFAKSAAAQLGMGFKPSPHGVFTDTASYTDLIGECTNLSVGYEGAHHASEMLDANFLDRLREKLINLDVTKLVFSRQPGEVDSYDWVNEYYRKMDEKYGKGRRGYYGQPYGHEVDDGGVIDFPRNSVVNSTLPLERLIADHADVIADLLEEYGFSVHELEEEIINRIGFLRHRFRSY